MNDQLDGVATPEESDRLNRALASSEDLRTEYRRLSGVFQALSGVEMEEPPAELKQNVMRAVRQRAEAPARAGWLEAISAVFRARPVFRYAYSFAAGAALGVLAFAVLSGNSMSGRGWDGSPFTGAMAPPQGAAGYQRISSRDFVLHGGHVRAEVLSGKGGTIARITARTPVETDVALLFNPADWSISAVRQHPAGNEVMLGSGRLSVRMQQLGQSQYLLYLARTGPAGSPLRITIHSPDGFVQGELDTAAPRSGS